MIRWWKLILSFWGVIQTISKILDTYLKSGSIIDIKVSSKIGYYDATIDCDGIVIKAGYTPISKVL